MGRLPIVNATNSLDQLSQILTRESIQCDLLAQNIVQERDVIKRMALSEFVSINRARIEILEGLASLKGGLDAFVREFGSAYHMPEADRTLTEILHRVQSSQAGVILQQYERFAEKVRAVKQDISVNQLLIKNIQSFLLRAMEAHRPSPKGEDLYTVSGCRSKMGTSAALIRRRG